MKIYLKENVYQAALDRIRYLFDEFEEVIVVDGFHRYYVGTHDPAIMATIHGYLPVVVIDKDINDRMASTVRHNRARGRHSLAGMSGLVFSVLDQGWEDARICNELGMEPEELLRLKHLTGFSKLFKDREYNKAWVTRRQILIRKNYQALQEQSSGTTNEPDRIPDPAAG